MTYIQCSICKLSNTHQEYILRSREQGLSYVDISKEVTTLAGHPVSHYAVRRHLLNHSDAQNNEDKGGVSKPPKRSAKEDKLSSPGTAFVELNESGGHLESKKMTQDEVDSIKDLSQILEMFSIDPSIYKVKDDTVRISKWQQREDGEFLTSYRFQFEKIYENLEDKQAYEDLVAEMKDRVWDDYRVKDSVINEADRLYRKTTVVPELADFQIGKVDIRGTTEDFKRRIDTLLEKYAAHLERASADSEKISAVLVDVGDIIEGFENTSSQQHLNDMSLMRQIDLALVVVQRFIELTRQYTADIKYLAVPSNHCAWRKGKDYLGKPSDDWGIFIAGIIQRTYEGIIEVITPDEFKKSLSINIDGVNFGFEHGDSHSPGKASDYLQKQILGGEPVAGCEVFVHGHYHNHYVQTCGRTMEGKQRWVVGCATNDNGSSWYSTTRGVGDSDPGMTVINIVDGEFAPQNVYFLKA